MAFPDRRTLNVLMTAVLFGLVLAIVYVARAVIVIFAFSILFAYLINPIVRFLPEPLAVFKKSEGPARCGSLPGAADSSRAHYPQSRSATRLHSGAARPELTGDDGKCLFRRYCR